MLTAQPPPDGSATSRARCLRVTALVAVVAAIVYLPLGAITFAGIAIASWRWRLPTRTKVAYTGIALILLVLLTFALPVTFEAGPVTIT